MFFRNCSLAFLLPTLLFLLSGQIVIAQKISNDDTLIIRSVTFTGNTTTKAFIIERELSFSVGDTLPRELFESKSAQSKLNLLNTSLFNFVTIYSSDSLPSSRNGKHRVDITIDVKERWYTWPAPVFEVMEQNMNTWWRNGHNFERATYGFLLTRYNFRGRKETVALICRFGYSKQYGGQYSIPYLNKNRTLGVTFTGLYTCNHEVFYGTRNNQLLFYKDTDSHIRKEFSNSIKFQWRKEIFSRQTFDIRYTDLRVTDTVLSIAPDYFVNSNKRMRYFSLSYQYVLDHRDNRAYPLIGYFADIEVTRHGLSILPDEDLDITFVAMSVRKWMQISKRIYAGGMIRGRWLPGPAPPFYHQRALGFSTYIRGFEYYVIDGQSYVLAKTSVRYQILKPHIFQFNWFPVKKFNTLHLAIYAGLFGDAGYVEDRASVTSDRNTLGNSWLASYGLGVDVVSYYDLVFRFEYTFNSLGEGGFFLHFGAPF